MRDYTNFDKYLDELRKDLYPQPEDEAHTAWAEDAIEYLNANVHIESSSVLDVGCGTGFCSNKFRDLGFQYFGITAGNQDYDIAKREGRNVRLGDMSYIPIDDEEFDIVFARHVLEHSPFPIITLMEWRRVAKKYLSLIAPAPDYWQYGGKNHYAVAEKKQLWWWLRRAGWKVIKDIDFTTSDPSFIAQYADNDKRIPEGRKVIPHPGAPKIVEYRFLCEKVEMINE